MAQAMPQLYIIAEPQEFYRERYKNEMGPRRSQRFIHAEGNAYGLTYPTIGIPDEWIKNNQQLLHIRLTLSTVPNERAPHRCIHPYVIDTEDTNVIKDPSTNSLYFPVLNDDLLNSRKSFQFTVKKLTRPELKEYGLLKLLDSSRTDEQRLEDPTDIKKLIEIYQLEQSQLLFSVTTFQNDSPVPFIYSISSVYSRTMTGFSTLKNDDDTDFRCSPQRGDWEGGEEVLMVIPKIDKRKVINVRFEHPQINPTSAINFQFVDTKTISFSTPKCPELLTRDNPKVAIPIVVTQSDIEIARIDFIYESLNKCLNCNSSLFSTTANSLHSNKRPYNESYETDEISFHDSTSSRMKKEEFDHSHIRNVINTARMSSAIKLEDEFPLLESAIQDGEIDLALNIIQQTDNVLEQENDLGETPLLLAAKLNQSKLITKILKERPELAQHIDKQGNNLLHLLANISDGKAKETIEDILMILDTELKGCLMTQFNGDQQTPKQVAENHDIDKLLNNISEDELLQGFDVKQWEELINSGQLFTENSSTSILSNDHCDTVTGKQNVIKLSTIDKVSNFSNIHKYIIIDRTISIVISPSLTQRVRYEKECEETLRFVSVPQNRTVTIKIPDLRSIFLSNDVMWMRITRTTIDHRDDQLISYHPYPIWIKNKNAKIHHGSIFIKITEKDMKNRALQINHLTMIRLRQKDLAKIKTLGIYSPSQLDFTDFHPIINMTAKQIRDEYNLRYSILNFQLICVDQNNIAFPINCFCQTEPIREIESNE